MRRKGAGTPTLLLCAFLVLLVLALCCPPGRAGTVPARGETLNGARRTLSLDGAWQIGQGGMDVPPTQFDRTVPVPGLVDEASPAFDQVGVKSDLRQAFWYQRTFRIAGPVPAVATLKVFKAMFGARVSLNGTLIGEHLPCFTPGIFDVQAALKGNSAENVLTIRVGADRDALPPTIPNGSDGERQKYIPGIFDSVQLILSGSPAITSVQCAPDLAKQSVRVQALIQNTGPTAVRTPVTLTVRAWKSGAVAGIVRVAPLTLAPGETRTVNAEVPIKNCRLWSPESPFLYDLESATSEDDLHTRFGMREFHFAHGRAYLNGHVYYMRGSNITLYRFFEDAARAHLPWDAGWVRRLNHSFKGLHWNCLRYSIGFPPEQWYDIADEEGILIQNEFPIWGLGGGVTTDELAREYGEEMRQNWNHPSVVLWDAQNESPGAVQTGQALQQVRDLDLSHRPWDNGWGDVMAPTDSFEAHPYHFLGNAAAMPTLAQASIVPAGTSASWIHLKNPDHAAIVNNEYGGIWLQRNGLPTNAIRNWYNAILGPNATPEQYRRTYAHYMAADTEFWRCHRTCAAVMQFTALGYSRPDGVTSDNFVDVTHLVYEPHLYAALRDAFAPTGLMLDYWEDEMMTGQKRPMPVLVVNDLYTPWRGTLRLRLLRGSAVVQGQSVPLTVDALGAQRVILPWTAPAATGRYVLEAALVRPGSEPVRSLRDMTVTSEAERQARLGLAAGKTATASSVETLNGTAFPAANAVDNDHGTRWSSEHSDPQWLEVDLGAPQKISRVELDWEAAYGKSYHIQVSQNGQDWTDVYQTDNGQGGQEKIGFTPVTARYVRLYGSQRGTMFGYSLWEMRVFP